MEIKDTALFNVINTEKLLKAFTNKPYTGFCTSHSKAILSAFMYKNEVNYFHITDSTKNRLKNIPTEQITSSKLTGLKPEKGLVYFNNGLHFLYLIRKNGVYIMTSSQKTKNKNMLGEFYANQLMDGFLYYDLYTENSSCYINNVLDMHQNKDSLLNKEISALTRLKKILKEVEKGIETTMEAYREDYKLKWDNTKLCLQAFMFIFFAKIINTKKVSQEGMKLSLKEKFAKNKQSVIDVIQVDTFYDENMKVINPFSVKGHFRNQPYGKDRLERKLIYIDGFMKAGYERKATKLKLNK